MIDEISIVLVGFHDGGILENQCSPSLQDNQKLRDDLAAMKSTLDSLAKQSHNVSAPTRTPNPKAATKRQSAPSQPARACEPNDVDGSQPDAESASDSGKGGVMKTFPRLLNDKDCDGCVSARARVG